MTIFGNIDHVRSGAVGDTLEIIRAVGFLVERDAGLVRGLEFYVVADCCHRAAAARDKDNRNKDGQ